MNLLLLIPLVVILALIGVLAVPVFKDAFATTPLLPPTDSSFITDYETLPSYGDQAGLRGVVSGIIGTGFVGLIVVVFFVLSLLFYGFFFQLSLVRLTTDLRSGRGAHYMTIMKWSLGHVWSFFVLQLRVFIYTWVWVPIVVIFAYGILQGLFSALGSNGPFLTIINYVLGILGIASVIVVILRIPRVLFAQYPLTEELGSKEALQKSIAAVTGHWWRVVLYILGTALLFIVVMTLLVIVLSYASSSLGAAVNMILSFFFSFFMIVYLYDFYKSLTR